MFAHTGIIFDSDALEQAGIEPLSITGTASPPTQREIEDATSWLHDKLHRLPLWCVLEILPFHTSHEKDDGTGWTSSWRINLGRGRVVPDSPRQAYIHRSVKERMQRVKGYHPRAKWNWEPLGSTPDRDWLQG